MKTIKEFIKHTNIDPALIRAVIKQMGGFETFKETAIDITNHGIDGGYGGFIYYTETVPFAKRHRDRILKQLDGIAADLGESNAISVLKGFNCLKPITDSEVLDALLRPKTSDCAVQVYNALAWFAAEEVCRTWVDFVEQS